MHPLSTLRPLFAAAALAFIASGCGPHATGPALPQTPAPTNPYAAMTAFQYDNDFMQKSRYLRPANFGSLGFDVVVKLQNPEGLVQYASDVLSKTSGHYHAFLSPEQIADRFFATSADYEAAIKYAKRYGLKVAGWKQRYMIHVAGTQQQLERAFGTKFGVFQYRNETFIGPMTAPSVAKGIPILGSPDIVYRTKRYTPSLIKAQAGNGFLSGYSPQQIQIAFDYAGAYNVNYSGNGITIGIIGTGPVSIQSATHVGDLEAMRSVYRAQGKNTINLVPVQGTVDGIVFSTPPPVTQQCSQSSNPNLPPSESPTSTCNPEDGEAQTDTEQAALLAPSANINYYLGYTSNDGSPQHYTAQGLAVVGAEIQQALNDNAADVLSMSFGGDEQSSGKNIIAMDELVFAQASAQGISVFASSGDFGAYACQDGLAPPQYLNDLCVSYPASSAFVTAVGGVNAPLNSAGQFTGPLTAWGESTAGGLGGTGGGVSAFIKMPQYQILCPTSGCAPMPGMQAGGACGSQFCRNVPDVSLDADPLTGVAVLIDADHSIGPQHIFGFGGTSVATPEMSAEWAIVLGVCKVKPGFCSQAPPNPQIPYRLGVANAFLYPTYYFVGPPDPKTGQTVDVLNSNYALTYYDVLFGDTGQCPSGSCATATPFLPGQNSGQGYDLTTGLGVPFARALVKTIAGL